MAKKSKDSPGKKAMMLEAMGNETMGKSQKLKKAQNPEGKVTKKEEKAPVIDKVQGKKVHIMPKVEKHTKKSKKK